MKHRAFTLIEVMVSTGIIVLMLGVSLPAFTSFQKQQNLAVAADTLRDAILEAHNYALAPRPVGADGRLADADYYRTVFIHNGGAGQQSYAVDEESGFVASTPNDLSKATWKTNLRTGLLGNGVVYCGFSPSTLGVTTTSAGQLLPNGIIYSIGRSGRIVNKDGKEVYGTLSVYIRHTGLNEGRRLDIQADTGQVTISTITANQCPGIS